MPNDGWVLCEDCHRVLYRRDGPVCPECLAKREAPPPKPSPVKVQREPMPEKDR